jgi:UDP-N-acetyl-2-amino-2-deoxyglucuronate dehydrogenase
MPRRASDVEARRPTGGSPLRVGVIGAGVAASWFVDILRARDDADCPLALRSRGGDLAEASARLGVRVVDDPEAFFAAGLDAVVVASPSGLHSQHVGAALEHGLHVLVEKPIAIRSADVEPLVALAEARDLRFGVVFQRRADPVFVHVASTIAAGALGRIVGVGLTLPYLRDAAYYASAAWRGTWALDGGGVLMNQGIHLLDVLVWWFGEPRELHALAATQVHDVEVEDSAAVVLRFAGPGPAAGALGSVLATTAAAPGRPHVLDVLGERGSLRIEGERAVRWDVDAPPPPDATADDASARDPRATDTRNHARVVADFLAAVREARAPLVDAREGLRSLRLVERVYAAAGVTPIVP